MSTPLAGTRADAEGADRQLLDELVDRLTLSPPAEHPREPARRLLQVLVAVDASEESKRAAKWARFLHESFGAHVTVVHVMPSPVVVAARTGFESVTPMAVPLGRADERREDARRALEAADGELPFAHDTQTREGDPAAEIVGLAHELMADLVIVGTHVRRPLDRILAGSVANAVRNRVATNVLLARGEPTPGDVLCAVDGSAHSREAAQIGHLFAQAWGKRTFVVHAIPPRFQVAHEAELRRGSRTLRQAERAGIFARLTFGEGSAALQSELDRPGLSLVSVGSRGHGAIRSLLLGSVSSHVAQHSPASVLIVKGDI